MSRAASELVPAEAAPRFSAAVLESVKAESVAVDQAVPLYANTWPELGELIETSASCERFGES